MKKHIPFCLLLVLLTSACNHTSRSKTDSTSTDSANLIAENNDTTLKGITFNVSPVKPATALLKTYPVEKMLELKIGKKVTFFPDEHQKERLIYTRNNGFVETLQYCYDQHRPLKLTPDYIWLLICQATSIHINQHYDSLKNIIFKDGEKEELRVRNDSLEKNSKYWGILVKEFSISTRKYTCNDLYNFFVPHFSTTTPIQTTAYQIALLESYKQKFNYVGETGCGIPQITIGGTKDDWIWILNHLSDLDKLGLEWWGKELKPVIKEFINIFDNKINIPFWQSIYKDADEYGAFHISGWMIKFFPYLPVTDGEPIEFSVKKGASKYKMTYKLNGFIYGNDYKLSTLQTDSFPSGLSQIEVKWINYFTQKTEKMEVYAGFFGVKQQEDKTLEPFVSWLVCKQNAKQTALEKPEIYRGYHNDPQFWSPNICQEYTDSAIYDIKRFKSQHSSLSFLKNELLTKQEQNNSFKGIKLSGDTLHFIVTCDGSIVRPLLTGKNGNNKNLVRFLEKQLTLLPKTWMPALAHPNKVLEYPDFSEEELKLKVKANSEVKIVF